MTGPVVIAAIAAITMATGATTAAAKSRLDRIENSLQPAIKIEGRPFPTQSLTELMRVQHVPAISVAFIDGGQIAWVHAVGVADGANRRAVTPGTLFQAGSISKAVTATAALALVQAGRVGLDETINTRLTSWKISENEFTRQQPVTLRELLTHTAGVNVVGFTGYPPGNPLPSLVQILAGAPPTNTDPIRVDTLPGSKWRYSGGGYTIAQLLMIEVSGQTFPELLTARVLAPLGMRSSTFEQVLPSALDRRAAHGYLTNGDPLPGGHNLYPEMAAAGLWTTPSDLARWVIGIEDAVGGRSKTVLNQTSALAMLTPGLGKWGLGVEVRSAGADLSFSHGGADEGFRAEAIGFPSRRQGVVIMSNSDGGETVIQPLLDAIARDYGWPGFERRVIKPVSVRPGELQVLTGRYALGGVIFTISETPGGQSLEGRAPGYSTFELIPQGGDAFVSASTASPANFVRDQTRKVVALEAESVTMSRLPN